MPLTNSDKKKLDELFKNVGFEGFSKEDQNQEETEEIIASFSETEDTIDSSRETVESIASSEETEDIAISSETKIKANNELDPEIAALLGGISVDKTEGSSADELLSEDEDDEDEDDEDEDFDSLASLEGSIEEEEEVPGDNFLEETSRNISPRFKGRIKQQKEEEVIPVENNTLPTDLKFNSFIQESNLLSILKNIGEITEQVREESRTDYLEEEKKKSRIMSRVKQHEVKDIIPVENHTIPETLVFNLALSNDKIIELLTGLGEVNKQAKEEGESYLEEEKKNARLMRRIKQHEVKEVVAVNNNTMPKKLLHFNFNISEKKIKSMMKTVGD